MYEYTLYSTEHIQWEQGVWLSGVNDNAESDSAVSVGFVKL